MAKIIICDVCEQRITGTVLKLRMPKIGTIWAAQGNEPLIFAHKMEVCKGCAEKMVKALKNTIDLDHFYDGVRV